MPPRGAAPLMVRAAVRPSRRRRVPPCAVLAAALATLAPVTSAAAQSVEDRARGAAQSARARTADSDALRGNYVTPGLGGGTIATIDGRHRFHPRLVCQKSATLLEVLVQPSGTGDLASVRVSRDTDLDGTLDSHATLPVTVSGICSNGLVSCAPGSWSGCRYFRWDVDGGGALELGEVSMPDLAGCYCINNSCGTNLAWSNLASILGDLGGGIVGALTSADPRIGIAEAAVDGPVIRYAGAQATSCTADPRLAATAYRANPTALEGDAFAASAGNPVFQMLAASPVGTGKISQARSCTIERRVATQSVEPDDILARVTGGYSEQRSGPSVDWLIGRPSLRSPVGLPRASSNSSNRIWTTRSRSRCFAAGR